MSTQKTSVVLVSGGWHTEFHCRPVVPYFQQAGYIIIPQPLNSVGHPGGFEEDVTPIKATINSELDKGQDVAVIVHSAGGNAGCEAVNRVLAARKDIADGQIRIIFCSSFINWEPITARLAQENTMDFDAEKGISYFTRGLEFFFNDIEPSEAQPFIDALEYQSFYPLPTLSSDAWQHVPLFNMHCARDASVLPDMQQHVSRQYNMKEVMIDSGHCPFVTQPKKFVEVVDSILRSDAPSRL